MILRSDAAGGWLLAAKYWKPETGSWRLEAEFSARKRRLRVLRRGDAFFDECVPFVTMRTLPEQFRASIPAADADVRVDVKDRVVSQIAVPLHEGRRKFQL